MAEKKKTQGLQETFTELSEVMSKLNDDNISLEESFELYKKGMDLLKQCDAMIDKVEKELITIEENG